MAEIVLFFLSVCKLYLFSIEYFFSYGYCIDSNSVQFVGKSNQM